MDPRTSGRSADHWRELVDRYENRNAALEERQTRLGERLRAMECALPSILMSAVVSMQNGTEPPKVDLDSILSLSGTRSRDEDFEIELVYERGKDPTDDSATTSATNPRFATGDDGLANNSAAFTDDLEASVVGSRELIALGRIQELAEQERSLKRYILDLENRERTFRGTLERANGLLNDPFERLERPTVCPAAETEESLSSDPVIRRLQKLEFYNERMIASMKGLRREKNVLVKRTEILKAQLRSTQEKLGEVQKEVLGAVEVIPVMGEPSSTDLRSGNCSCASMTNGENSSEATTASPKTLVDLAEKFEDVLRKAKNHGLCKLSGPIREAAAKLKELSESEEGYTCVCNGPWESAVEDKGPCPDCKCGKFDLDKFGDTGDWFCDSCGGDCVCDLVSLEDEPVETGRGKSRNCQCGCRDEGTACECGCGTSGAKEVDDSGDIPKTAVRLGPNYPEYFPIQNLFSIPLRSQSIALIKQARKLSEELGGIICKDCGNCKCGDDHSRCPGCVEACGCSRTAETIHVSSDGKGSRLSIGPREPPRDSKNGGPRCPCSDSDAATVSSTNEVRADSRRRKLVRNLGNKGVRDSQRCFECEQQEPCDDCSAEELDRLETSPSSAPRSRLVDDDANTAAGETGSAKDGGSGDKGEASRDEDSACPCGCEAVRTSPEREECLCGCDGGSRPRKSCERVAGFPEPVCDCESAMNGRSCERCRCVDSVIESQLEKSPETCPCIEESLRDGEMEGLARKLEEEADSVVVKNNLLRELVARCASASTDITVDPCLTEGCPYHDSAAIRPTISGLATAVELLREKSRGKDAMIAVLVENFTGNLDADEIGKSLATPRLAKTADDFDRCRLYDYLNEANAPPCRDGAQIGRAEEEPFRIAEPETSERGIDVVPAPRDFRVVREIFDDCLLVAWTEPGDISTLNGYEILVNGYLASRVRSPTRTEALLVSLDTSRPVALTLCSVGPGGSCSKPVRISHSPCARIDR